MSSQDLYANRGYAELFPELERLGAEYHAAHHEEGTLYIPEILSCIGRLLGPRGATGAGLLVGCGPKPRAALAMADAGYSVTAIEPVSDNVRSAQRFCGSHCAVVEGCAEKLPVDDASQRLIIMESVLEHVESVRKSLDEAYRVLSPGGVLYIYTTNRYKLSLTGFNGEYTTRFLNWFPRLLKECYVHHHLHFQPELANFNARPAVHWFSYADLCAAGRDAGFATFYSILDLADPAGQWASTSRSRRWLASVVRRNPWLRALALTQAGGSIFMVKRAG
jgi:SAM-dependent methyltransferase